MKRCKICNYLSFSDDDDSCLKCGASKDNLIELTEDEIEVYEKSEVTNDCLSKLISLCSELMEVAIVGIEEDLDPSCRKVFSLALSQSSIIKELSKAEIIAHVNKKKY